MSTEHLKQTTRHVLSGFLALGLAVGLTTGVTAQEEEQDTKKAHQQQMSQEQQITAQELENALTNADGELQQLAQRGDLDASHVKVVHIDEIMDDQEAVSELSRKHQKHVEKFRTELRDHAVVKKALEDENFNFDNLVGVHVSSRTTAAAGQQGAEAERTEMAAQPTIYIVVSGSAQEMGDEEGTGESPGS